ncbi:hypothetical protein SDC9_128075 [bioreactor metagenome]|uniref:Uncharacterized protein n=1 Tax=bioreactor metagenome TaxID=1076179 RepID=A0A645CVT0_9ZZZZ
MVVEHARNGADRHAAALSDILDVCHVSLLCSFGYFPMRASFAKWDSAARRDAACVSLLSSAEITSDRTGGAKTLTELLETLLETFPGLASSLYPTGKRLSIVFSVRSVVAESAGYYR